MQIPSSLLCAGILVAATAGAPAAHHSAAAYENSPIVLTGATIKNLVWANPHSILMFEVEDDAGTTAEWNAESGSPSALTRMGWNRNAVKEGDRVTIELFPARNGAKVGRLVKIVFADGRELLDSMGTEGSVGRPTP